MTRKINIVLYEPEIAQNVGAVMRTAVAIDARLHLIEPFGFPYDERHLARPSANEYKKVDVVLYDDWSDFEAKHPQTPLFCLSRYGKKPISDFNFSKIKGEVYLLFGRESTGIPKNILRSNFETTFRLPMVKDARSLNLANTVGIASYEVLRQWDYLNLSKVEVQKGENYLFDEEVSD